jgi:hypothetical protein|tara:strand:+ start:5903 stop:7198 length:1296 start_codon:yes stop_codon:yes gene_type:complete
MLHLPRTSDQIPLPAIIVLLAALLLARPASALPLTNLKGQGLESIYGAYAPGGECTREPRITIDEDGFAFRVGESTVRGKPFERALTFMGPSYDGISAVFFPFPASNSDFGPLVMIVNDEETPGLIRVDSNLAPGQRLDPLHAALNEASPFIRCEGSAPAPVTPAPPVPAAETQATRNVPVTWVSLPDHVGEYDVHIDSGEVGSEISALLGTKMQALLRNMSAVSPLRRQGSIYYLSGNAPHQGGMEQAYILLDADRRAVQVGLWERGKLTVYSSKSGRIPPPPEIRTLLASSPPEDALAAPGTPWEIVPVQNRPPIAYVEAAASPNIKSLSLFCEGARPMMAMLLNKPFQQPSMKMTWNFAGRLVHVPLVRANREGTFWQGSLAGSALIGTMLSQSGSAYLRVDDRLEGEALLTGADVALRTALRPCQRL